ncbi:MAG: hypothetical protein KC501_38210, partial [Myxococcales bacterium]|nr:hypothetical protein [Myxococcales bacterium]
GRKATHRLHLFDKLDGSNLRFEWSRKGGWERFGTRHRVIDESHPVFGSAFELFGRTLADPIARVALDQGWDALVAFGELWGPGSLGGRHVPEEPKRITLFDVAPYRRGFVGPQRFLELFGDLDVPAYLGEHDWDDTLVAQVRRGELPGITVEGVVGKAGEGHRMRMAKAKTQAWVDRILAQFGEEEGRRLVQS